MHRLAELDRRHVWHPFTQMRSWLEREPIVIVDGNGAVLRDAHGREYLDANSSIWTNLHGHKHSAINTAIKRQLGKIAHSSALGLANEPASLLASKLIASGPPAAPSRQGCRKGARALTKIFFSDDGSTAMEVALKLAYEYARRTRKDSHPKFLSLEGAYHGDTIGAVALGHVDLFHKNYSGLLFKTDKVMSPYCYRCPFNRAKPDRADAREYRKCNWECTGTLERKFKTQSRRGNPYAAFVFEPLIQGAAGMIAHPQGWLSRAAEIARAHKAQLLADEVLTGFGRTGSDSKRPGNLFACSRENVQPDLMAVAKALTGGYLPLAATFTTQAIFDVFLGEYEEFKTFFHGHSYTANQLGSAAALANLELLESSASLKARLKLEAELRAVSRALWRLPNVGDIRQVGLIMGIELVRDWRNRKPFELREQAGIRVCEAMARRGVLTRPIGNAVVIMPPYCTTANQVQKMMAALYESIQEVCLQTSK
jgi:adenosylmethionine-8-amino-7-oxononanoate transaminase